MSAGQRIIRSSKQDQGMSMIGSHHHTPLRGHCLCGAVSFHVDGPLRPAVACHCNECRRFTGSFWTATAARRRDITIRGEQHLGWFALNENARRGFCTRCGSSLFFDPVERDYMAIGAGCLDKPTRLSLNVHIWAQEAGDYYSIADGLPQRRDSGHGLSIPHVGTPY
jgi:hypothetical protein